MPAFIVQLGHWWSAKCWPWLRVNWRWVLFPVGIVLLFLQLTSRRRSVVVHDDEQSDAAKDVQHAVEAREAERVEEARVAKDAAAVRIVGKHLDDVAQLQDQQREDAEQLTGDPEALSKHLLNVGKDLRK